MISTSLSITKLVLSLFLDRRCFAYIPIRLIYELLRTRISRNKIADADILTHPAREVALVEAESYHLVCRTLWRMPSFVATVLVWYYLIASPCGIRSRIYDTSSPPFWRYFGFHPWKHLHPKLIIVTLSAIFTSNYHRPLFGDISFTYILTKFIIATLAKLRSFTSTYSELRWQILSSPPFWRYFQSRILPSSTGIVTFQSFCPGSLDHLIASPCISSRITGSFNAGLTIYQTYNRHPFGDITVTHLIHLIASAGIQCGTYDTSHLPAFDAGFMILCS